MKYSYCSIHAIRGLHVKDDSDDILLNESDPMVVITANPNKLCFDYDRSSALAFNMLTGFKLENLNNEIEKIQKERINKFKHDAFLVYIASGVSDFSIPEINKDYGNFIVCYDKNNTEHIRDKHSSNLNSLLTSIYLSFDGISNIKRIRSGVIYHTEDNKLVYLYSTSLPSPTALVSHHPKESEIALASKHRQCLLNSSFVAFNRLVLASLNTHHDNLRSFSHAWSALEIFTNKFFDKYKTEFLAKIPHDSSKTTERFLNKINDVMKGKYSITDKFNIIIGQLCPESSDTFMETFKKIKNDRDNLSHGKDISIDTLQTNELQRLIKQILRKHLERIQSDSK